MDNYPYSEFISQLVAKAREFAPEYRDHLETNDALIPHVLLGAFTFWLIRDIEDSVHDPLKLSTARARLKSILTYLESEWQRSEELRELMSVSFLENLDPNSSSYSIIKSMLGPGLSDELKVVENSYGWIILG